MRKESSKECFVKQVYEYGERLEYDFGEVKLLINGLLEKYYMAVISSPAGNFRWAFLYRNQRRSILRLPCKILWDDGRCLHWDSLWQYEECGYKIHREKWKGIK